MLILQLNISLVTWGDQAVMWVLYGYFYLLDSFLYSVINLIVLFSYSYE